MLLPNDVEILESWAGPEPRDARLQALQDLWLSKVSGDKLPSKSAFPPSELKPWLGHVALTDVTKPPSRFRIRLMGVELVRLVGRDCTGRWLDELVDGDRLKSVTGAYMRCIESRGPLHGYVLYIESATARITLHRVHLPCATNGVYIDTIIACAYAAKKSPA